METLPFDSELVSLGIFRSIEMKLKFIYTTFNQYDDAIKVKEHLVSSNLAICINLFKEVESIYQDDQEIIRGNEIAILIKSAMGKESQIIDYLKENHPYEVPGIFSYCVESHNEKYNEWVDGKEA